jgi:hypothetical protein
MRQFWFFAIAATQLYSCRNGTNAGNKAFPSNKPTDSFFPVTSFLKGQVHILDSLPVTPVQITTAGHKTDSVWLTKDKLKEQLAPFLSPPILETNLTGFFRETVFNDQTLNAITFTYDPIARLPDSISIRHWDVYVNPETGTVSKVYLVKDVKMNDQRYTEQLTWQTNTQAKIALILNKPGGAMELVKEVVYKWKF